MDFEYRMRNETTAQRPDVTIEYKNCKLIQTIDMACSSERNVNIYFFAFPLGPRHMRVMSVGTRLLFFVKFTLIN